MTPKDLASILADIARELEWGIALGEDDDVEGAVIGTPEYLMSLLGDDVEYWMPQAKNKRQEH